MKLIERLIEEGGKNSGSRNCVTPTSFENIVRLFGRHFPSYVENELSRKNKRVRKYVVCSLKNGNGKRSRRETHFECKNCYVGFRAAPCF
ncbi:piggyBac transposable element-derived protein 4 [Nephila pilipes]|uniref:PiggyBac transposable element-derived protein 4 n=1 Tax=Nephila pilipes TaxID=299642 RepID=A0A8X6NEE6_NEPPI|nr:piggyBac transposable element-derived protein 4 [Nephila pilipes]